MDMRANQTTYDRENYIRNREKFLQRQKEYQKNPEVVKRSREYHRKYMKKFYKENREEWNQYMKIKQREWRAEKRAKEKNKHWWSRFA